MFTRNLKQPQFTYFSANEEYDVDGETSDFRAKKSWSDWTIVSGIGGMLLMAAGTFVAMRYRSVPANKFMAKTGPFVKGVHCSRKTIQWPFQEIKIINMEPINYHFLGSNMSEELVPFELPLTFTVSPVHPEIDLDGFIRYATRLGDMDHDEIKNILSGIVNGETRVFVAGMTIDEIFKDKEAFKNHVVNRIQKDLDQFGIKIYNANIEEMKDTPGNSYFENLKKKALENALTRSKLDVAEARKIGDIGEKDREVATRKERSILEADARETETTQNQRISDYVRELAITQTSNKRLEDTAKLDAYNLVETRKIEIDSELNKRRQAQELERLRSEQLVLATAETEALIKRAEADAMSIKIRADADAASAKLKADADFYTKSREADATQAILQATSDGLDKLYRVSHSNPEMAQFYLSLEKGLFNPDGLIARLGQERANAVRGLQPRFNIWNTGSSDSTSSRSIVDEITRSIPPMVDFMSQSGIKVPSFLSPNEIKSDMKDEKKDDVKLDVAEKKDDTKPDIAEKNDDKKPRRWTGPKFHE